MPLLGLCPTGLIGSLGGGGASGDIIPFASSDFSNAQVINGVTTAADLNIGQTDPYRTIIVTAIEYIASGTQTPYENPPSIDSVPMIEIDNYTFNYGYEIFNPELGTTRSYSRGYHRSGIWYLQVPSGQSVRISSPGFGRSYIHVYKMLGKIDPSDYTLDVDRESPPNADDTSGKDFTSGSVFEKRILLDNTSNYGTISLVSRQSQSFANNSLGNLLPYPDGIGPTNWPWYNAYNPYHTTNLLSNEQYFFSISTGSIYSRPVNWTTVSWKYDINK